MPASVVGSFNRILQVAPTAQKRTTHIWTSPTFLFSQRLQTANAILL